MESVSKLAILVFVIFSYFVVTSGVIYDIINEPPSIGSSYDEKGNQKPAAILVGRVNGQYIMEGLAAAFMFILGGAGLIALENCNDASISKTRRVSLIAFGFSSVLIAFFATRMFMSIKIPGYTS
ncbi:unnamed protein product [Caenorhabditis auriculariae]|uniref:Oligosaccharyltransferase complex subunit n=1 Tax=Caenorhabditis auriculariae TaxID=2777116 RepID=A0A8S1GQU1_9PELO|nr:unnamed protein product [Caenorhabditis auriculariae]